MVDIVLIDDDYEEHRLILRQLKSAPSLNFRAYTRIEDALEFIKDTPPDLVLIDAKRRRGLGNRETAIELQNAKVRCPVILISTIQPDTEVENIPYFSGFLLKDQISWENVCEMLPFKAGLEALL